MHNYKFVIFNWATLLQTTSASFTFLVLYICFNIQVKESCIKLENVLGSPQSRNNQSKQTFHPKPTGFMTPLQTPTGDITETSSMFPSALSKKPRHAIQSFNSCFQYNKIKLICFLFIIFHWFWFIHNLV